MSPSSLQDHHERHRRREDEHGEYRARHLGKSGGRPDCCQFDGCTRPNLCDKGHYHTFTAEPTTREPGPERSGHAAGHLVLDEVLLVNAAAAATTSPTSR